MILKPKTSVKRLDHHGIVAGVIHDIGLIDTADELIPEYGTEQISVGQTVACMVMNGLGFTDRALSLSEEFFELLPTEKLIGPGVVAEGLDRHKLSRTLDRIYSCGCSRFFSSIASRAALQEGLGKNVQSLDTTSFSLSGNYDVESDTESIEVVHGYSKDHRPDLKQVVAELIVSHDGDVPLALQMHDGNAEDTTIFQRRCEQLKDQYDCNQTLVADSKLYCEKNAANLREIRFVTRIPEVTAEAKETIQKALDCESDWYDASEDLSFTTFKVDHFGISQNWHVCLSREALVRATKTLEKQVAKEKQKIQKELFHLQAQRFACEQDARQSLEKLTKKWRYHDLAHVNVVAHKVHGKRGRPAKDRACEKQVFQIEGNFELNQRLVEQSMKTKACFIVGSNDLGMAAPQAIETYKSQGSVERGFRFLKDPRFFASSMFLKKPERIEALVTIMTLSLLVYTIAQRRIRKALADQEPFIPNSSKKLIRKPTLKRIFQLFQGISLVTLRLDGYVRIVLDGMTEMRRRVLEALGGKALEIYLE